MQTHRLPSGHEHVALPRASLLRCAHGRLPPSSHLGMEPEQPLQIQLITHTPLRYSYDKIQGNRTRMTRIERIFADWNQPEKPF